MNHQQLKGADLLLCVFDAVAKAHQTYSMPILNEFKAWMEQERNGGRILPKSAIKSAFKHTLNRWNALYRYTEQGYLSMHKQVAFSSFQPTTKDPVEPNCDDVWQAI